MITVTTLDGLTFQARTAKEAVSRLRRAQWNAPDRKAEYMIEVAARVTGPTGVSVRTDDPMQFLTDLEDAGVLQITVSETPTP